MLPLICIDVDGTLIGSAHVPTEGVWRGAEAAIARGQHLALSTARGAFGPTYGYAERLDPAGWHVFHAGAALVHTGTGEVLEQPLPASVIEASGALAAERGYVFEQYTARDYVVNDDGALAVDHAALMGVDVAVRGAETLRGQIVRVQFVVPESEVPAITAAGIADAEVTAASSPVMPGVAFVSVTPEGVTKATAIAHIAQSLAVSMADVMMVGDGQNDVEAMLAVGHGTAMANASKECKAAAVHHVGHVDDDGLVDAFELSKDLPPRDL